MAWNRFLKSCRGGALLAALLVLPLPLNAASSNNSRRLWRDVDVQLMSPVAGERIIVPRRFRLLAADLGLLTELLNRAPMERSAAAQKETVILELPLPYGGFSRFRIVEAPILEPALAARYPEIRTYRGQGMDDPGATAALDQTPAGFHAMILSEKGSIYIDPYHSADRLHYISYFKRDLERGADERLRCNVHSTGQPVSLGRKGRPDKGNLLQKQSSGAVLRTYRLAAVANVEYTAAFGGTVSGAIAGMTTTVNRVDGIYERELAVRLVFVYARVYTAEEDGYVNADAGQMLDWNQFVLDFYLGSANYDIGHVFSTGGGGLAGLGVVCKAGEKAMGVTGSPTPVGDPFDVDFVAHEMGHQFDANHTFNAVGAGNCSSSFRNPPTAFEPGSGSTIMSYAGICGAQDLQLHSDDYFHGASFDEIVLYTTTGFGSACPTVTATGNSPPVVSAPPPVTIPAGTPFALTGIATDPNGDALTYCWEQFDLGPAAPPNTDDGFRPIFRSFRPVTSPSRTFPKLADILGNTSAFGESLPAFTRALNFSLTARDNRVGGGGVDFADAIVNVTASAGPFLVTFPNTTLSWGIGSTQTVAWNPAGTTAPPISCGAVHILLSRDGGNTFPTTLASGTPNDGSQTVTVPGPTTVQARIKVECANNIFFDISDADFAIFAASPAPVVTSIDPVSGPTAGGTAVTIGGTGFQAGATVKLGGVPATGITVINPTTITATTALHAPGPVDVVVTNPDTQTAVLPNGYTYSDTAGPLSFFTLDPCRVADTRGPAGAYGGPALEASAERVFTVAGRCGVPATARTVSFNVTVTGSAAPGHLILYPGGTPLPLVSAINFRPGQTRANNAVVPLGSVGTLAVFAGIASGSVELILDVNGYFE